jgi:hypothetical protein
VWGINWRRALERRQASIWRREIAAVQGKVIRLPTKREIRANGACAKAKWDALQARRNLQSGRLVVLEAKAEARGESGRDADVDVDLPALHPRRLR